MRKLRYRLHWASGDAPKPSLKWVVYDWKLICPVAYVESRVTGRKVCALLNAEASPSTPPTGGAR
jgi:hypothetical protein